MAMRMPFVALYHILLAAMSIVNEWSVVRAWYLATVAEAFRILFKANFDQWKLLLK